MSKGRRIAFRAVAALFALGTAFGLFGVAVIFAWFDKTDGKIHRVHDMAFGVLFGAIATVGLLAQTRNPERRTSALFQVALAGVAVLIAGLAAGDAGTGVSLFAILVVAVGILVVLHPARDELTKRGAGASPVLAALVVLAAIPLLWYSLTTAKLQRDGLPSDPHVKNGHWTLMTAMLIALVLVGLLAALRYPGWRITAWSAGAGAFLYGLASLVFSKFPGADAPYPGSKGVGWGLLAMVGGLLFIGMAELEARKPAAQAG